jgi:hypothetical protein
MALPAVAGVMANVGASVATDFAIGLIKKGKGKDSEGDKPSLLSSMGGGLGMMTGLLGGLGKSRGKASEGEV